MKDKKPMPEWVAWVGLAALLIAAPFAGSVFGSWVWSIT